MEVHVYLHGRSIRYEPSAADLVATVDDLQADTLADFWNMERARLFPAGYVWFDEIHQKFAGHDPKTARGLVSQGIECEALVTVALQPTDKAKLVGFVDAVISCAERVTTSVVVFKAHPRDSEENTEIVRDRIKASVATDRLILVMNELTSEDCVLASDIVVTMTSNVGFEAAVLDRPVLSYYWDEDDPIWVLKQANIAQAVTALADLRATLVNWLANPLLRDEQRHIQSAYFERNPGFRSGHIAQDLVARLEAQVPGT